MSRSPQSRDLFSLASFVVLALAGALSAIAVAWGFWISPGGDPPGQLIGVAIAAVIIIPGAALGAMFGLVGMGFRRSVRRSYWASATTLNLLVLLASLVFLRSFLMLGLRLTLALLGMR